MPNWTGRADSWVQSSGILQFRGWADKERLEKKTTMRSVSLGHSSGDAVFLVSGAEQGRHLCRVGGL